MVRYLGPRLRILRRLGIPFLLGFSTKYNFNKYYPPGQHGKGFFGKKSEFSLRLLEKQKLKYYYGLTEKKLKTFVNLANQHQSTKGLGLLSLIETRLDVTLFRIGFSKSVRQARQFITHEHVFVNKYCVKTASFTPYKGDIIYLKPNSSILSIVKKNLLEKSKINYYIFLESNLTEKNNLPEALVCVFSLKALVLRPLRPRDILLNVNYSLILEFYIKN